MQHSFLNLWLPGPLEGGLEARVETGRGWGSVWVEEAESQAGDRRGFKQGSRLGQQQGQDQGKGWINSLRFKFQVEHETELSWALGCPCQPREFAGGTQSYWYAGGPGMLARGIFCSVAPSYPSGASRLARGLSLLPKPLKAMW